MGLEEAGFEPVFVNELHPDAMATYLANRSGRAVAEEGNYSYDILELTQDKRALSKLAGRLRAQHGEVGLVAGGPPCQGYSGIGHRRSFDVDKVQIPSNHLYREMARFIEAVAPQAFLFENVRGLLTARWTREGRKGEIWADVQHSFSQIRARVGGSSVGYRIGWELVRAKDYGVPQNRPRVLLVGIREDLVYPLPEGFPAGGLLPKPGLRAPNPEELLGDLEDPNWIPGGSTTRYPKAAENSFQKALRRSPDGRVARKGAILTDHQYSRHSTRVMDKFSHMIETGGEIPEGMRTKKFAQRVLPRKWGPEGPAITATSLPDDYVHYSQPRVLTVREWARLQMFPDWYRFVGKRTTGGRRRAGDPSEENWTRDLPKYTQIGNAVPVGLAKAVGCHLAQILDDAEHASREPRAA